MKKILLVDSEKGYLPEIPAYLNYFNSSNNLQVFSTSEFDDSVNYDEFDIIWEFKGIGGYKPKKQIMIHEYHSLSTGSLVNFKNILKNTSVALKF